MPLVSRVMIRTALIQLALGATLGGLLLAEKGLFWWPWLWTLRPGHIQLMLFGWTIQFALGVAVWILPRLDAAGSRGNLALAWAGYGALNSGVALATLHQPLAIALGGAGLRWMLPVAGLLHLGAISLIVAHIWQRVRPFVALQRPSSGDRSRQG